MLLNFSYSINNKIIFDRITINNPAGNVLLVTGNINNSLSILSGILCGFIPAKEKSDIEHLQTLFEPYFGDLTIHSGNLKAGYYLVGDEPDRHFIFSRVFEEFHGRTKLKNEKEIIRILEKFNLNQDYYYRKINTLSGGEKIKLALAIAYIQDEDKYLFFNTVPWLDNSSRDLLYNLLKTFKQAGKHILVFEQEYEFLHPLIDETAYFTNNSLVSGLSKHYFQRENAKIIHTLKKVNFSKQKQSILKFDNITFHDYQNSEIYRERKLLNKLEFEIFQDQHHILFGENGSGKSTIFNLCFRLINADSGEVYFLNKNIKNYKRKELCEKICYISQFPQHQLIHHTFKDYKNNIEHKHGDLFKDFCDLSDDYSVMQMNNYELKIILLFSLLNENTKLILLDEPGWGLDKQQLQNFLNALFYLCNKYTVTIFAITHANDFIKRFNFNVLNLKDGNLSGNENKNY